jgi:predicted small integral membrane protein
MTLRMIKLLLVFGIAILYFLFVFNNVTDYGSNYEFTRHVMMMDSTFPGNHGMWRAVNNPSWHTTIYVTLIVWETAVTLLGLWGGLRMLRALDEPPAAFHRSKRIALAALTLGLLEWLVAFLAVGGEWFLMWQSKTWNGQDAAFRMFTVVGIVLLVVAQPDSQDQP